MKRLHLFTYNQIPDNLHTIIDQDNISIVGMPIMNSVHTQNSKEINPRKLMQYSSDHRASILEVNTLFDQTYTKRSIKQILAESRNTIITGIYPHFQLLRNYLQSQRDTQNFRSRNWRRHPEIQNAAATYLAKHALNSLKFVKAKYGASGNFLAILPEPVGSQMKNMQNKSQLRSVDVTSTNPSFYK